MMPMMARGSCEAPRLRCQLALQEQAVPYQLLWMYIHRLSQSNFWLAVKTADMLVISAGIFASADARNMRLAQTRT